MHEGELRVTHVHKHEDVHALVQGFAYFPLMQICSSDVRCTGRPKTCCTSFHAISDIDKMIIIYPHLHIKTVNKNGGKGAEGQ